MRARVLQASVVQRRLSFAQVADEQVADGAALQVIAVDEFPGCALPGAAHLPQGRGRILAKDSHGAQKPVGHRDVTGHRGEHAEFGVQQFQDVPDGDVAQPAALGRDELSGTVDRVAAGHRGHVRVCVAQGPEPGEPFRVPGAGHVADEAARASRFHHQPAERGPHNVSADS